jgi:response regulator RpfG family c-di-GMP phosphodiesterase
MNIFYCEDDEDDTEFFAEALQRINPEINLNLSREPDKVVNILSAMEKKPDFIFLDCYMPIANGMQVAIRIKRKEALRRIPIIIISGGLDKSQIAEFNRLGIYMFVTKGDLDVMEIVLRDILYPNVKETQNNQLSKNETSQAGSS